MDAILICVLLITIIVYLIYTLANRKFDYWKKKNIPYIKPLPILGNYGRNILLQDYIGCLVQKLCQKFPNEPYFGAFFGTEPVLIVQNPHMVKHVLTKDFYYFNGRVISNHTSKELLTQNVFFTGGDQWKVVRTNLTPLFSTSKIKNMFYLVKKCCQVLEETLDHEIRKSDIIEARDLCVRFTMDSISSCAFGIEVNALTEPQNNPFRIIGDEIFRATYYRGFKLVMRSIWPTIFYSLGFKCFPPSIDSFFSKLLKGIFMSRNYKTSSRHDFVDQVLNWHNQDFITSDRMNNVITGLQEKVQLKVDDDLLLAQCLAFFGGGFETSASTLSLTLFELAKNQDAQERAAKEVNEYLHRHGNKMNYDSVNELPYLEACMYETLRLYPVLGNVTREVMEDCTLPDGVRLDKGVRVHIPIYHLHRNPDYFPEPEEYQPERFLSDNKKDVKPFTFLPFGEGPRACIGKRFAIMQIFAALIIFLKKYQVELAEGMPRSLVLDSRTILTQAKDTGLMLKFYKREG